MAQPTLESLAVDFVRLQQVSEHLGAQVKNAARIAEVQRKIIDLALDELMAMAQTEAVPVFFRKQIAGTLLRIKEVARDLNA